MERSQEEAAKAGAAALGGAAMAALAGLLGAFLGAGLARAQGEGGRTGRGLGWRIALQRTDPHGYGRQERTFGPGRQEERDPARSYAGLGGPERPTQEPYPRPGYERGPGDEPHPRH
jgi:hypothetical protein